MSARRKYDMVFLGITLALVLAGFFMLASASLGMAAREGRSPYSLIVKQLIIGAGGFVLLFVASRINYRFWKKWALPLFILSFLLSFSVKFFGMNYGGATRWISFGMLSFQPSELLKFSFVVYLGSWLANKKRDISSVKTGFLPFILIVGFVAIALVIQPDIGTLGVICITGAIMFFLAGGKFTQIGLLVLAGIAFVLLLSLTKSYMWDRIEVFLDSSHDEQGVGYQLKQAKIALGSGGIFGVGYTQGPSKFTYLPEPAGDSIFAIIGEELGFVGTSAFILLFFMFFYKSIRIALNSRDAFGRLLASGIAILIVVQSFINMYAIVGLIPLTGLPLIFVSQGGSAMAMALIEAGVILNISKS